MRLYGSFTSPFVRRIRFVAQKLELTYEQIDTMTERGQEELRKRTPIWKVPYVEMDDLKIWDSHAIIDCIFGKYGTGSIRIPVGEERWRESNLIHAIDAAVESAINVFYLGKDGILPSQSAYLKKQTDRVDSILKWVRAELRENFFTGDKRIGLSELALYTSLDWMRFRDAYPVNEDPVFKDFLDFHASNEDFRNTEPV
ncbi:MAG: glutathione S-transferase family protein [Leptospira sp.]|nr:glutathione S-transferase family protein [Leptospira sp.]